MTDGPVDPASEDSTTPPGDLDPSAIVESPIFAAVAPADAAPAVDEPAVDEPAVDEPVPDEPVVDEATVEQSVVTDAPAELVGPAAEAASEPVETAAEPAAIAEPQAAAASAAAAIAAPAVVIAAPATHAAPKRRRWPWVTFGCVLLALLLVASGTLWYVSGLIGAGLRVPQPSDPFPLTVLTATDSTISYSGTPGGWTDQGLMGIGTVEGGYDQTNRPQEVGEGALTTTTRDVTTRVLPPPLAAGQAATLDGWYFPRNPKVGLGVDFQDILYSSPAGPTPAWYVPGTASTWVIFTHGRGATPREGLRIASTASTLGYPMLLISYRDDAHSPAEDGYGNFGATEWPDLEAAVRYALDHGAKKVVLAGASMGAAITLAFLQNSPLASEVSGAFLDSPAVNLGAMVEYGAADMGLPAFVTAPAMQVASWRFGIDWAATDYSEMAATMTTPTLIVQGTEDTRVRAKDVETFATAANPTTVQLEIFEGAGHVMSWNVDRSRYDRLLTDFLASVAPSP